MVGQSRKKTPRGGGDCGSQEGGVWGRLWPYILVGPWPASDCLPLTNLSLPISNLGVQAHPLDITVKEKEGMGVPGMVPGKTSL